MGISQIESSWAELVGEKVAEYLMSEGVGENRKTGSRLAIVHNEGDSKKMSGYCRESVVNVVATIVRGAIRKGR